MPVPSPHAWIRLALILAIALTVPTLVTAAAGDSPATAEPEPTEDPGFIARLRAWRLAGIAVTDAYLVAGPTGTYVNLQDTRMAPLIYSGFGAGLVLQNLVVRPRWVSVATLAAQYASPTGTDVLPGFYQNVTGQLDVAYLYRIGEAGGSTASRSELMAGGSLSAGGNLRLYDKLQNSALNLDIVASVNANARWSLPFAILKRSMTWYIAGATPLFSYVGRYPEYTLDGLRSYWAPPWQFLRLTFETGLTAQLRWSEENRMQLSYLWDFYAMNELDGLHLLRVGTHRLGVSLGTKRM
ncbi:MAG: hypothetical protein V3S41_00915 [Spirochaetia bacterium]